MIFCEKRMKKGKFKTNIVFFYSVKEMCALLEKKLHIFVGCMMIMRNSETMSVAKSKAVTQKFR